MYKKMRMVLSQGYEMFFDLVDSPIADLWLDRMLIRHAWPLDDPSRFYGFNNADQEAQHAQNLITESVDTINRFQPIVTRPFSSVYDQDYLNYLHNIFERYHGLLDQQSTAWWQQAPESVHRALCQLNIAVHRCESLRHLRPRIVCTWFGMPKTHRLTMEVMQTHGQLNIDFGGVYLNYVEIGKTLLDLAIDDDHYIADGAFQPFDRYSADFVIYFYNDDQQSAVNRVDDYYQRHQKFFQARGIMSSRDARALPLKFKVAQLDHRDPDIMHHIKHQQTIQTIEIL